MHIPHSKYQGATVSYLKTGTVPGWTMWILPKCSVPLVNLVYHWVLVNQEADCVLLCKYIIYGSYETSRSSTYRHDHNTSNRTFFSLAEYCLNLLKLLLSRVQISNNGCLEPTLNLSINNHWLHDSVCVLRVWLLIILQCTYLKISLCTSSVTIYSLHYYFNLYHFSLLQCTTHRLQINDCFKTRSLKVKIGSIKVMKPVSIIVPDKKGALHIFCLLPLICSHSLGGLNPTSLPPCVEQNTSKRYSRKTVL